MEFRKFTAGDVAYGTDAQGEKFPSVNFNDPNLKRTLEGKNG